MQRRYSINKRCADGRGAVSPIYNYKCRAVALPGYRLPLTAASRRTSRRFFTPGRQRASPCYCSPCQTFCPGASRLFKWPKPSTKRPPQHEVLGVKDFRESSMRPVQGESVSVWLN